ncbi:ABC transporter ATP-binding protein [Cloacibacterium normanense]|jgi:Cu-processing system ATP-binding protein|uniref:ABC transporter ATP-binding protein n=1 Tax=Cloacibacterium normanense TaxID=237258 RepID=A0A1E5UHW4_9FLAO|nr:ABC transporter ATP-binding protein [Cloacibacterium normanense]AZI68994.1 ABC transporter ATP-binding protein [Cloacibacterium normanense]OEL12470.1 ABC transporter family protein [Cloacibacterium normanense]PPZ91885.1 ABC transporter ATP-binding protein [Cloacibacterium normanense]SDO59917.1 Cu-processing system ATP-binding protein [Cloacibacterium normanense]
MIEIKNLTKKFNKFTALNQVNIRFNDGHSVALIGPNGCGKTTLIKCILGLNVVEDGDILVNNESVKEHYLYRKNIGYMPQIGRYPENMTIAQTIQMIKDTRKVSENELDTELLEAFELESIFDKKMRTLSGGTTQKVSAVLAFLFNPGIIILDEPTAGLDPLASEILKNKIIKEKNKGKLIIITSHLLSELDDIVSEIVFMNEGKVIVHQSVEELMTERKTEKISESIISILKEMKP